MGPGELLVCGAMSAGAVVVFLGLISDELIRINTDTTLLERRLEAQYRAREQERSLQNESGDEDGIITIDPQE